MLEKLKEWCLKQWKAVLAFAGLAAAAAAMYLRSKDQKKILDYANKSHKKELEVNKEAEDRLLTGSENLTKEKEERIQEVEKSHKEQERQLQKDKKDFIEDSKEDQELAKKLAEKIGADFVE